MKPRLKLMGIGAIGGAVLLLIFWILGDVAHFLRMTLQDSSFFLGLILFLFGVLFLLRQGKYVRGRPQEEAPAPKEEKEVSKGPYFCLGAGLLNLVICGLTFLF